MLEVIVVGRVLAGVSTTLLWSVFESWMVAEYNARGLGQGQCNSRVPLSAMYGVMTTYNCITAILAGLVAHCVVLALGSKMHLFILALVRLCMLTICGLGHYGVCWWGNVLRRVQLTKLLTYPRFYGGAYNTADLDREPRRVFKEHIATTRRREYRAQGVTRWQAS